MQHSPALILNTLSDAHVAELLSAGKVGAMPTDTTYHLVCAAASEKAVERFHKILKSQSDVSVEVLAGSMQQLADIGFKLRYLKAVEQYWPGLVSVMIPCVDLKMLHQGAGSIAVRIGTDKTLNVLINSTGPLLTADLSTILSGAVTPEKVAKLFSDSLDFYVDGGDLSDHKPPTVIRVVDDAVEIVRPGAVTIDPETGAVC